MGKYDKSYIPPDRRLEFLSDLKRKKQEAEFRIDKNEIFEIYSEYKKFMKWDNAPDFKIELFRNKANEDASITPPTDINPFFVLNIWTGAKLSYRNAYRALLYHEFTHIFDHMFLGPVLKMNSVFNIFTWYSEAHAELISLMCLCNFQNKDDNRRVDLLEQISNDGGMISLDEYFSIRFDQLQEAINNNYEGVIKPFQYYLGCLKFFQDYCTISRDDFTRLSKTDYLCEKFNKNILKIMIVILKGDTSPDSLKTLRECDNDFLMTIIKRQK